LKSTPFARRRLLWPYVATGALLLALAAYAALTGTPAYLWTRDPAAIHDANPFLGAASNLGILLWTAAASLAFFTAARLRGEFEARETRAFLVWAGLLTTWLLLDDLFMLHERLLPDVVGIPQWLTVLMYGALLITLLARFREVVAVTDTRLLGLSLGSFVFSAGIDQAPGTWHTWEGLVFLEDAAKLFGIVSWLAYFAMTCEASLATVSDRALFLAGSPSLSRTRGAAARSRAGSPKRDGRDSSPPDARSATPGSPLGARLRSRTTD
jgi:hypothetical protein